ncbi:acetyl-CoA carboxylase carboxyltransferase subunit alpha [Clostridium botulinum]|uniref:Acetyl-coenzyme A carboxylase carboxyl transferase subunit alpha n=1 Tax=Clostridium botulinum C/D str. DC5 TaxID=1443128 RepID=A0A0A0I7R4_CLOBO|nr:acetyl-CoA carboxylase carboxyltransferase subunit alpha [Clostridium botulinum]KGM97494.1 acetyl-CoA carboxylase subunit alpha [Clostridium botulinum C/D str. DC5]KOC52837.1 acetyl-CoA carboxylase subunit alpha [Clostridium botulinum]KOC56236.1 acetyl-CoA carboxylase subunit alpha [Clostridium botulinum]MCD3233962.1 acetyl-CoA carboxylase carboxyltransferase subunit alpha [Clostridium botulinum D/C]MCD3239800.1 acetyl-CoA carboxylase carboxyltransferase subunit alpha [Clostridium botulinum
MLQNEKQVIELRKKIDELKRFSEEQQIDLSSKIQELQLKLQELKKNMYTELSPLDKLTLSRMKERPTALDYIERIFDGFIELHGDRGFKDDPSIVGGIAKFNGIPVTVIGQQKGRDTKENIKRNFGMANPEGYRKALRLMKQAEKFKRPVICFIDTPGAFCGVGAEERGQGEAIAKNLMEMAVLKTPIISIVIGEGGSGGALGLSIGDEIWMLEHSVYSVLSPEGFAAILWKDGSRVAEAASLMKITAQDLKGYNIIDRVIQEPTGGAHKDLDLIAETIKRELLTVPFIEMKNNISKTLEKRYDKYRKIGEYSE